jgi:hypothetical protein
MLLTGEAGVFHSSGSILFPDSEARLKPGNPTPSTAIGDDQEEQEPDQVENRAHEELHDIISRKFVYPDYRHEAKNPPASSAPSSIFHPHLSPPLANG